MGCLPEWDGQSCTYGVIPNTDNWYKRAIGDEYAITSLFLETTANALAHPEFLSVGGNTGQVNTFAGVDFANLTGGVFSASTLLEGNNLGCFVLQAAVMVLATGFRGSA
ncbi:hypothetical protein F5051DRAFT_464271 [Lentinula edodes]|nr:hypothetical protein F5051DRAFT_464271 [Lentinula edodes]